jgi:nucleotide-binding universal stress UspA family protein
MMTDNWTESARHTGTGVVCHVAEQFVGDALNNIAIDHDCEAIVIGLHEWYEGVPTTLGHTTSQVLQQTQVPVIAVRNGPTHPLKVGGTIVVGVGHGPATSAALRWARVVASSAAMAISLVHARSRRPVFKSDGILNPVAYYVKPELLTEWTDEDFAELAAKIHSAGDKPIPVRWKTMRGLAGPRLVEASRDASVLVIGRHVRTGSRFSVPSLHYALVHAPCPVAVIPASSAISST